jgi:chromate reductase
MASYRVGYLVGSLSAESINRILSKALVRVAPDGLSLEEIPIKDLPLYNRDFDADYPPSGRALKDAIAAVDALLFVTPEHNRGLPSALKNAIDWASRPWGTNSLTHKPCAVIGASPGKIGTALAQQQLRSVLGYCASPQLGQEAYIQFTPGLISDDGEIAEESTEKFLRDFMEAFAVFIGRVISSRPQEG